MRIWDDPAGTKDLAEKLLARENLSADEKKLCEMVLGAIAKQENSGIMQQASKAVAADQRAPR